MVQTFEAILVGLLILGAAYTVATFDVPQGRTDRAQAHLERLTEDGLLVLRGLEGERGPLLDAYLAEAYHCAFDAVPSTEDCHDRRPKNLSFRLSSYLPVGASHAVLLGNGIASRDLYRSLQPAGEMVAGTYTLSPDWNFTFVQPDFSCYDPGMPLNATLVPVWHGAAPRRVTSVDLVAGSASATAEPAGTPGAWNATLAPFVRPDAGVARASVVATGGSYEGAASYASCPFHGTGTIASTALRSVVFDLATGSSAPVSSTVRFTYDAQSLLGIAGLTLTAAEVWVYDPVPPRPGTPDSFVRAATVPLSTGAQGQGEWVVPDTTLWGRHPVVLHLRLSLDGVGGPTLVTAHRVAILDVALPSGTVPVDPPYFVGVQAWFPDWR